MRETWVWSLGGKIPWGDLEATHSSIFAWGIPWTEKPGGLQFMGSQRAGHDWVTKHIGCGVEGQRLPNLEVITWARGVSLLKDEQTVNGPKTWKFGWRWTSLRSSYFTVPTSLGRAAPVSGRLYQVWPSNKGMAKSILLTRVILSGIQATSRSGFPVSL